MFLLRHFVLDYRMRLDRKFNVSQLSFSLGEDPLLGDQQQYRYMTADDMKSFGDDSMRMDVTSDEKSEHNRNSIGKHFFYIYLISL